MRTLNTHKFRQSGGCFYEIRKKRNLTQKQIAALMGIHSQFISNIEMGLCALPNEFLSKGLTKQEVCLYLGGLLFDRIAEVRREIDEQKSLLGI